MIIKGEEKTDEEIIMYVNDYVKLIESVKEDRFHDTVRTIPEVDRLSGLKALDYGCGWGRLSISLRDKGYIVDGIDLFQNEIDICNLVWKDQDRITYAKKRISEYEDSSFDLVLSTQVIEHVHNVGNYLSEINRVLKPGGGLVITLPNVVNPRFMLPMLSKNYKDLLLHINKDVLNQYLKGSHHINAWDPTHFVTLLSTVGFKLHDYLPSEGVPFPKTTRYKKLLGHYWYTKRKNFRQLSTTMIFRFEKVDEIRLGHED